MHGPHICCQHTILSSPTNRASPVRRCSRTDVGDEALVFFYLIKIGSYCGHTIRSCRDQKLMVELRLSRSRLRLNKFSDVNRVMLVVADFLLQEASSRPAELDHFGSVLGGKKLVQNLTRRYLQKTVKIKFVVSF